MAFPKRIVLHVHWDQMKEARVRGASKMEAALSAAFFDLRMLVGLAHTVHYRAVEVEVRPSREDGMIRVTFEYRDPPA